MVSENGQAPKTTLYLGNLIFENNNLQFVSMEEGRFRLVTLPSGGPGWASDYFLKDHLGNVRMMLAENGEVLEETHYYPFGLSMNGISYKAVGGIDNKYKFNSIEQNFDFDLNFYETVYRTYDPQIGRFHQIDPKVEIFESFSTYTFAFNNPNSYKDQLGDAAKPGNGSNTSDVFYYIVNNFNSIESGSYWNFENGTTTENGLMAQGLVDLYTDIQKMSIGQGDPGNLFQFASQGVWQQMDKSTYEGLLASKYGITKGTTKKAKGQWERLQGLYF